MGLRRRDRGQLAEEQIPDHQGLSHRKGLIARRLVVVTILALVGIRLYYTLFFTDLFQPVLAQVVVAQDFIQWVRVDPSRLVGAAAVFILTHIGMYEFLTGRRL